MKLKEIIEASEILESVELDEGFKDTLKNAAVAAAIGFTAATPMAYKAHQAHQTQISAKQAQQTQQAKNIQKALNSVKKDFDVKAELIDPKYREIAQQIADEYNVDIFHAVDIVKLAYKYEKQDFPKARDILAVIDLESSFNKNAVSQLKADPAIGLMQIRPETNGLGLADLNTIDEQIKHGVEILNKNYNELRGNKLKAVQAYNIGLKKYKDGNRAPKYLAKYKNALKKYAEV